MMSAKEKSVKGLTGGIEFLFKKNKVDYVKGHGKLVGPNEIEIEGLDGSTSRLRAKNIILATGSEATPFPGVTV